MLAEYTKVVQNLGLTALDAATDEACSRDLKAKTKLVFGRAANCMIAEADLAGADAIGLCATHRGTWNSSYLGSATCALAINSHTSLLVAKGQVKKATDFTAVLATDHSNGSDQWIDHFVSLAPQGITHIHVVSAYEVDDEAAAAAHRNLAMLGGDVERWLFENVSEKTSAVANKLTQAGFKTTLSVTEERATDAIRHAMQNHHADLLVIGAHGNKQLPGAKIGSVALHEIVAEPYPVFLVRP
jgi:nucleotide-binding universal stress UspA family protein